MTPEILVTPEEMTAFRSKKNERKCVPELLARLLSRAGVTNHYINLS